MRLRAGISQRWCSVLVVLGLSGMAGLAGAQLSSGQGGEIVPFGPDTAGGAALVERLREGGLVMYFRHADTTGTTCDRTYRIGDRAGQRNISEDGREQSRRIGDAMEDLGIPIHFPVLTGPVCFAHATRPSSRSASIAWKSRTVYWPMTMPARD